MHKHIHIYSHVNQCTFTQTYIYVYIHIGKYTCTKINILAHIPLACTHPIHSCMHILT